MYLFFTVLPPAELKTHIGKVDVLILQLLVAGSGNVILSRLIVVPSIFCVVTSRFSVVASKSFVGGNVRVWQLWATVHSPEKSSSKHALCSAFQW